MAISAALLWTGCNELLDLDRFSVRDAATQREDGGPDRMDASDDMDASRDACVLTTYYADQDGDGYGDPATALESCESIDDRVTNGDDCDDSDETRHPGAAETCDNVDQDCDGAVDEGLMRPLGDPIVVEPNFGVGDGQGASVVAHQNGTTVVWTNGSTRTVFASFYDRAGNALVERMTIHGSTGSSAWSPQGTLFSYDGLDQIFVAWLNDTGIRAKICATNGSDCSLERSVYETDPMLIRRLSMMQVDDDILFWWEEGDGLRVLRYQVASAASSTVLLPPVAGFDTEFSGAAYVAGSDPHVLFTRIPDPETATGAIMDGGTTSTENAQIIRVRGTATIEFDPTTDVFPWAAASACEALGTEHCGLVYLTFLGSGRIDEQSLLGIEVVAGSDQLDGGVPSFQLCGYGATPLAGSAPTVGDCYSVQTPGFFAAVRPGVATAAIFVDTGYALREIPITHGTEGSARVLLPGIDLLLPGSSHQMISMGNNHGGVIGNGESHSGFDVSLQRIGCEP